MSRRREAHELKVALELSTQQHDNLLTTSSFDLVTPASEAAVNSKDLELVEGSTLVMALEHEDIVADSEEEPEEIEQPINSLSLPLQQMLGNASAPSSIDSFTPSFMQNGVTPFNPSIQQVASPFSPYTTSAEQLFANIHPPVSSSDHKSSSPAVPTISPTVMQTAPSPRSTSAVVNTSELPRSKSKPITYGSERGSRVSVTPVPAINGAIVASSFPPQAESSPRMTVSASKSSLESRSEVGIGSAISDDKISLVAPASLDPSSNFDKDAPESSIAASKRSGKKRAVIESDEDSDTIVAAPRPTGKRSRLEVSLPLRTPSASKRRVPTVEPPSSPDPLELVPRASSSGAPKAKRAAGFQSREVVLSEDEDELSIEVIAPPVPDAAVEVPAVEDNEAPPTSTAKGKKGKGGAKGKKVKATPKAKAAPKGKGKAKATQAEPVEAAEVFAQVIVQEPTAAAVEEPIQVESFVKSPERPKSVTPPPEPVRRPLDAITVDGNRFSTPTRDRLHSGSPGPSKLGTTRTPQGVPLVNAMFGGAKRSGMSRRFKLPSLHTKIKTPPKALPPAPIKPVRKKKGEESDEDEDEEFDADGNLIKKVKVKGMEWYMMED